MKNRNFILILSMAILTACGGNQNNGKSESSTDASESKPATPMTLEEAEKNWETDMGVGPVSSLELPAEIDAELAAKGEEIYGAKCTACHKSDKSFIGPAPKGILTRRTPAWIMNMILNPDEMVQKNDIAKQLLIKFNGSPMANQNLTEEEARAVVEYFRTL